MEGIGHALGSTGYSKGMIPRPMEGTETVKARVGEGREPCVVTYRSEAHDMPPRKFVYISRFNSSSHVIITPSTTFVVESKWRSLIVWFQD